MMSEVGFDFSELDQFSKNLILKAQRENPKEITKFMRREGCRLRTYVARKARQRTGKKTGNYRKSIKRGKPYKYGTVDAIRAYSYAPHSHLIEGGYRLISHGKEVGFVKGKNIFRDAEKEFEPVFARDVDSFVEDYAKRVEK